MDEPEAPLTHEELREIRLNLKVFRTLQSLGIAGGWLKGALIWAAVILGGYYAFTEWILKFIRGAAGNG